MKRLAVVLAVVSILAVGAMAFAHGTGGVGGNYGGHMGPGYGGHMMGQGFGGPMMGGGGYDQEFLEETREMRREMHNKRFEYFEASRNPNTTRGDLAKLEKEIGELQENLYEKSPRKGYGGGGPGPGHCW
jgi:hypothetical protein